MKKLKRVCSHYWVNDHDEMKCQYCGRRLYRNPDRGGPKWIPAVPAGTPDPDGYTGDRRLRGSKRKLPNH